MPHFDSTITLSGILTLCAIGAVWVGFRAKVDVLLKIHNDLIAKLDQRFEAHEDKDDERFDKVSERVGDLVAGMQRLIGQNDIFRKEGRK